MQRGNNGSATRRDADVSSQAASACDDLNYSQLLFHNLPTGIITYRATGETVSANPAIARIIGATEAEVTSQNFRQLESWRRSGLLLAADAALDSGVPQELKTEFVTSFGKAVCLAAKFIPFQIDGEAHLLALFGDLTGQRSVEEAERKRAELEEQLSRIAATVPGIIYSFRLQPDGSMSIPYATGTLERMFGVKPDEVRENAMPALSLIHPGDLERVHESIRESARTMSPWRAEFRVPQPDGTDRWIEGSSLPQRESDGSVLWNGYMQDISERKKLDAELKLQQQHLNSFFSGATVGMTILDRELRYLRVNDTLAQINGIPAAEHIGRTIQEVIPDVAPAVAPIVRRVLDSGQPVLNLEVGGGTAREPGARRHWIESFFPMPGRNGTPDGVGAIVLEVTELKRASEALLASERRFREMLENVELIAMTLDTKGIVTFCNDHLLQLTGFSRDEVVGADWFAKFIPDGNVQLRQMFFDRIGPGTIPHHFQNPIRIRNGELREIAWNNTVLRDGDGRVVGTASIGENITERRRAELALAASETQLRALFAAMKDAVMVLDAEGRYLQIGPTSAEFMNQPHHQLIGRTIRETLPPAEADRLQEHIRLALQRKQPVHLEHTLPVSGAQVWLDSTVSPMGTNHVLWIGRDITSRKHLEEQFRQAQKMESIGQLAGGVAHDFNNLLTVIQGHAYLMMTQGEMNPPGRESLTQITRAAERAANLTRQLLAFSRRQMIQPRAVRLNAIVSEMVDMLQRLMGEDISLRFEAGEIPEVVADASMLDQVLMNLAVNARDAMPGGGTFTIRTGVEIFGEDISRHNPEALPGRFVRLSATDTGCGIAPENLRRIFEPFFTTKEVGKGTGLGLATSYGIIKQHGGWISVESEPGKGTAFTIYLPVPRP